MDAETQVNAVKGLVLVCETRTSTTDGSGQQPLDYTSLFITIKSEVMQTLFSALEDYSVDNRGDVGSWVRTAAMNGLEKCTYILSKRDKLVGNESLFDADIATNLVGGLVKQAVEKMDRLRDIGAKILQRILYNEAVFVPQIPYREKLEKIVPKDDELKWGVPSCSFPRFIRLLQFGCYSKHVMSGLVSECCWEGDLEEAKRQKLKLCGVANLDAGQLVMHSRQTSAKTSQHKPKPDDENESYSSLVGSAGF